MMPLTAALHFVEWSDIQRADAGLARKNDRVPYWRQRNLELRGKKIRSALRE
jgi:hypothetical protein